jgi:hypothetical protein
VIRSDGCIEGFERREKQIGSRRLAPFKRFIVDRSIAPVTPSQSGQAAHHHSLPKAKHLLFA